MRDLNRYVIKKYAADWKDIGVELGLEVYKLRTIEKDHPLQCVECFQKTLEMWLQQSSNATWRSLETALCNVKREPVNDVHGKDIMCMLIIKTYKEKHSDFTVNHAVQ